MSEYPGTAQSGAGSITEEQLTSVRRDVAARLSPGRAEHTLGVERAAIWMAERLCPSKTPLLRAAALLHDITKEYSFEKQLKICGEFGIILRDDEKSSPGVLHAITAAAIIPREYPQLASAELCGAVRWHTTGRADMTLSEKIIFLADYIEDGRGYESCRALRASFMRELDGICRAAAHDGEQWHLAAQACLDRAVLAELRGTLRSLRERGLAINVDTLRAEESICERLAATAQHG